MVLRLPRHLSKKTIKPGRPCLRTPAMAAEQAFPWAGLPPAGVGVRHTAAGASHHCSVIPPGPSHRSGLQDLTVSILLPSPASCWASLPAPCPLPVPQTHPAPQACVPCAALASGAQPSRLQHLHSCLLSPFPAQLHGLPSRRPLLAT